MLYYYIFYSVVCDLLGFIVYLYIIYTYFKNGFICFLANEIIILFISLYTCKAFMSAWS